MHTEAYGEKTEISHLADRNIAHGHLATLVRSGAPFMEVKVQYGENNANVSGVLEYRPLGQMPSQKYRILNARSIGINRDVSYSGQPNIGIGGETKVYASRVNVSISGTFDVLPLEDVAPHPLWFTEMEIRFLRETMKKLKAHNAVTAEMRNKIFAILDSVEF